MFVLEGLFVLATVLEDDLFVLATVRSVSVMAFVCVFKVFVCL